MKFLDCGIHSPICLNIALYMYVQVMEKTYCKHAHINVNLNTHRAPTLWSGDSLLLSGRSNLAFVVPAIQNNVPGFHISI